MVSDSRATLTLAQLKRDGHPGAEVDIKGLTAELGAVQARLAESP